MPTYRKHRRVKLIAALDYEIGEIFCIEEETYNVEVFLKFLKKILKEYPAGKIVMILYNTSIHHAKLI